MVKCPKCGQEIAHVIWVTTESYKYIVRLPMCDEEANSSDYDGYTGLLWIPEESAGHAGDRCICPLCREEVADNEESAAKLLKGG